jgi:hypothetical protein
MSTPTTHAALAVDTTTTPPPSAITTTPTLTERAHSLMHSPPPPPPDAVRRFLELDAASHAHKIALQQLREAWRRLEVQRIVSTHGGVVSPDAYTDLVAVTPPHTLGIEADADNDDDDVHMRDSDAAPTAAWRHPLVTQPSPLPPTTATRTAPHPSRRRHRRRTVSARVGVIRKRLDVACRRLALSPLQSHSLVAATDFVAARHTPPTPPTPRLQRTHTRSVKSIVRQSLAHIGDADTDAVVAHLRLDHPTTPAEAAAIDGSRLVTATDADRVMALTQCRVRHVRVQLQTLHRRLLVLQPAVIAYLARLPDRRLELHDGVLRLQTPPVTMTYDSFGDALCEYLLARGVPDPRHTVLAVAAHVFA